jgi:hypothetical protein
LLGDAAERVDTAVKATGGPVLTTDEGRALYLGLPPSAELNAANASRSTDPTPTPTTGA